jgi:hypothetical protein
MNMIKLSVGTESVENLIDWQRNRSRQRKTDGTYYHITRMWPKRAEEILAGGSMYWVIQGVLQARQKIVGFDEMLGDDGIRRCGICLDPGIIRTEPVRRRPFQGWRYFDPDDVPADLSEDRMDALSVPPKMMAALAEIGVR